MSSVFKKLLSKELGEGTYNKYFYCYQKLIAEKKYNYNEEIFNDMYAQLKDKDIDILTKMLERLWDTVYIATRINRTYIVAFLFYLGCALFLICQEVQPWITVISLILMSLCFLYKTYEFVVNKYCFIDAHIIIVYKSVLDRLILYKERIKK